MRYIEVDSDAISTLPVRNIECDDRSVNTRPPQESERTAASDHKKRSVSNRSDVDAGSEYLDESDSMEYEDEQGEGWIYGRLGM